MCVQCFEVSQRRFQARKVSADFWAAASVFALALARGRAKKHPAPGSSVARRETISHHDTQRLQKVCSLLDGLSPALAYPHWSIKSCSSFKDFLADNPAGDRRRPSALRQAAGRFCRKFRTQHVRTSHLSLPLCVLNVKALAPAGGFGISARQAVRQALVHHPLCPATSVLSARSLLLKLDIKSVLYAASLRSFQTCGVRGNRDRCIRAPDHPAHPRGSNAVLCNLLALPTGKRCWFKRCWQKRHKPVLPQPR